MVSTACKIASQGEDEGPDSEFVNELVSAVGEAFNNAVIHAYKDGTDGRDVAISVVTHDDAIEVSIQDHGASFDYAAVPDPDLSSLPESGMGLFIIRSFVDEVSYEPGTPNTLRMRKRLAT